MLIVKVVANTKLHLSFVVLGALFKLAVAKYTSVWVGGGVVCSITFMDSSFPIDFIFRVQIQDLKFLFTYRGFRLNISR